MSRLFGLEPGVTWTSLTAVAAVEKVLAGYVRPGFQTPAMVYGSDFALDLPGVARQDVS